MSDLVHESGRHLPLSSPDSAAGLTKATMASMTEEQPKEPTDLIATDLPEFLETAARQTWPLETLDFAGPQSYRLALGRNPIQLGNVEFRILLFLASRPYHAFTRRAIAAAVSTEMQTVVESSVDEYVTTLRDQLGVLHDYVQTVPYIGYRFKA